MVSSNVLCFQHSHRSWTSREVHVSSSCSPAWRALLLLLPPVFPLNPPVYLGVCFPAISSELWGGGSVNHGWLADPLPGTELKADFPMPVSCLGIPGWHDASLQSGGRPLCASNRAWMFAQGFVENLHYCSSHLEANRKSPFWCEANFIFVLYLRIYKLSQLPVVASKN